MLNLEQEAVTVVGILGLVSTFIGTRARIPVVVVIDVCVVVLDLQFLLHNAHLATGQLMRTPIGMYGFEVEDYAGMGGILNDGGDFARARCFGTEGGFS